MIVALMKWLTDALLAKILLIGSVILLALIPFHAFLTVWLASLGLNYTAVRLWKEVLLLILFGLAVTLYLRNSQLRQELMGRRLVRYLALSVLGYGIIHFVIGLWALQAGTMSLTAFGYALISNLRAFVFFAITLVVGMFYADWLRKYSWRVLLWPAGLVVLFGLLQEFVLSFDVLRHFGYGPQTIQPYVAVDQKVEYARLQSFLRGPNPLGAYLVIVLTAWVGLFMARSRQYAWYGAGILATIVVLYGTFSRSAYIGAAVAAGLLIVWLITSAKTRRFIVVGGVLLVMLGAGLVFGLRDNDYVQNVVFHTDENSRSSTSSNEARASALLSGMSDVVSEPLGRGPGTAGPASVYNTESARIAENYYIQVGQEVGVLGFALLGSITTLVGILLWRMVPQSLFAGVLLASLIGITAINMLSHAWADDTLAYVWWGFAGFVIGGSLLKRQSNADDTAAN